MTPATPTRKGIACRLPKLSSGWRHFPCRLVEITGGEPLAQSETPVLVDALIDAGYDVMLETNGSYDISRVNPACIKIVDIKCPSSGESGKHDPGNLSRCGQGDQLKFVIGNRDDYRFACRLVSDLDPSFSRRRVLFSPVSGRLSPDRLAAWILADGLAVRLHLQLHPADLAANRSRGLSRVESPVRRIFD